MKLSIEFEVFIIKNLCGHLECNPSSHESLARLSHLIVRVSSSQIAASTLATTQIVEEKNVINSECYLII